jgi:hypothetical protein
LTAGQSSRIARVTGRVASTPSAPLVFLCVALAAALALNFWARHQIYFFYDEYEIVLHRYSLHDVLEPTNGHPVIMWLPIYYALRAIFGLGSALPFQLVAMLFMAAAACLLFGYLTRRAGGWIALTATVVVLFLGSGSDVLFWPFQLAFAGSIGAGLAALLALELGRRRADVVAAGMLIASVFFISLGLAFVAAAIAAVVARTGLTTWRAALRRAIVVAGPAIVLFAVWYLAYGHDSPSRVSLENVATTPAFVVEGLGASLATLAGLAGTPAAPTAIPWGECLLVGAIALGIWRLLRGPRIAPEIWIGIVGALAFWVLTGVNQSSGSAPDAGRYDFVGAIFMVLILVELVRGLPLGWHAAGAASAIVLVSMVGNANGFRYGRDALSAEAANDRVALGALEIARDRVDPEFRLSPEIAGSGFLIVVDAKSYFESANRYGSPALSPAELLAQPEPLRQHADSVLLAALPVTLANAGGASRSAGCRSIRARRGRPGRLTLRLRGGTALWLHAYRAGPTDVGLRRFADSATTLGTVDPGHSSLLTIPADRSLVPWRLSLTTEGSALICRASSR